jgi:hypothetical protein
MGGMDPMRKARPRCHYCRRFISLATAIKNWKVIQAPGTDPEPFEIIWCDDCGARMENV